VCIETPAVKVLMIASLTAHRPLTKACFCALELNWLNICNSLSLKTFFKKAQRSLIRLFSTISIPIFSNIAQNFLSPKTVLT